MKDLKNYDRNLHDGIIFENIDFSTVRPDERVIKLESDNVTLDANVRFIFTTRVDRGKVFGTHKNKRYIYKKLLVAKIDSKLYLDEEESSESLEFITF